MAADLSRRRFFHRVAEDALDAAATVAGAAGELRRATAEVAGLVDADAEAVVAAPGGASGAPYREAPGRLLIPDLQAGAETMGWISCSTAVEVARAMRQGAIRGAPVAADVAALAMALTAEQVQAVRPWMRRAALREAAGVLAAGRPCSAEVRAAVARALSAWEMLGELHEDGAAVAVAVRSEATATNAAAAVARRAMAGVAAGAMAGMGAGDPLRVLLHGETGTRAAGPPGTALGAVAELSRSGRAVTIWVCSTSPWMRGPGSVPGDLAALGVEHRAVEDAAVGDLVRRGAVDVLLLATECVAVNGDVACDPGAYPLALLAMRHGVPVVVCGTTATVAGDVADGAAIATGAAQPGDAPLVDIVDAALVSALVSEVGVAWGAARDRWLAVSAGRRRGRP